MTTNNLFLEIDFSKFQLALWLGITLKSTKVLVTVPLSSENLVVRE